jgi:hypothetical protein
MFYLTGLFDEDFIHLCIFIYVDVYIHIIVSIHTYKYMYRSMYNVHRCILPGCLTKTFPPLVTPATPTRGLNIPILTNVEELAPRETLGEGRIG